VWDLVPGAAAGWWPRVATTVNFVQWNVSAGVAFANRMAFPPLPCRLRNAAWHPPLAIQLEGRPESPRPMGGPSPLGNTPLQNQQ
jgi:hypothetical protein